MEACQSYRDGGFICADGFIQKPICHGHYGCVSCGHVRPAETPNCCVDDFPERHPHFTDDGLPRYYREQK